MAAVGSLPYLPFFAVSKADFNFAVAVFVLLQYSLILPPLSVPHLVSVLFLPGATRNFLPVEDNRKFPKMPFWVLQWIAEVYTF